MSTAEFLTRPDGARIAYNRLAGRGPGVVFLHGLMSNRGGTKALVLEEHCKARGYAYVRFDMFGHGESSGRFEDGGVSRWTEDSLAVLDGLTTGPQVLVGSSMGGWVMIKTALARPARIGALVGIAVGPDFTEELMWRKLSGAQRKEILEKGVVEVPSDYNDGPYRISRHLIEDGRKNLVLGGPIDIRCPVRLIQGQRDELVPWEICLRVSEKLVSEDVAMCLIKDGDHRLSRPEDLDRLCAAIDEMAGKVSS